MDTLKLSFVTIVWLFASIPCNGEEAPPPRPVLLMLMMASDEISSVQEKLREELALELETHTLAVTAPFRFASDRLPERIEEIRKVASDHRAEAVIWLEAIDADTVSLQMVVVAPGRSTVRSVEAKTNGDTEGELAIATRELLKDIHIAVTRREDTAGVPEYVAEDTDDRAGSADPVLPASAEPAATRSEPSGYRVVNLSFGANVAGGITGDTRSPLLLGGVIAVGVGGAAGFHFDVSLAVFAAPAPDVDGGELRTVGVRPGLGIGYLFKIKGVTVGPYLGLQVPWQLAAATLDDRSESKDTWWNFRVAPGLDFRLRVHRSVQLLLRPGLGIHVNQEVFQRESDGAPIYASPYLDWNLTAALVINFS